MTPGAEHEENRIHCRTVRHSRVVATQGVPRPWRQKRLHLCPQSVRQAPAIIANPPSGLPQSILLGHLLNMAMPPLLPTGIRSNTTVEFTSIKSILLGSVLDCSET